MLPRENVQHSSGRLPWSCRLAAKICFWVLAAAFREPSVAHLPVAIRGFLLFRRAAWSAMIDDWEAGGLVKFSTLPSAKALTLMLRGQNCLVCGSLSGR